MTSNRQSPTPGIPTSWLFTPGTDHRHFDVAERVAAGVALLDLEDAVAPDDKDRARALVVDELTTLRDRDIDTRRAVRINTPGSTAGLRDVLAIAENNCTPHYLVVPKVESAATTDLIADVFTQAGVVADLVVMIESARGVVDIASILGDGRAPIAAVMFGAADMAGDLGAEPTTTVVAQARNAVLHAAAAAGVPVIDSPFFDIGDADGLMRSVDDAVRSGCAAKAAIHPGQITTITAGFTPPAEQVEWATEVIDVASRGVGTVDGQMIDEAIARRARRILVRAGR
ncbi:CoA ester lyase [Williamsia herbipolensis]|uniref:CoA ester lyase n=1 Tax=Williamsia herbipolensis TaxID=1603258 RepID=A0AAU4K7U0_9NOCA|nr:aldolase/citrate lyase family protein [Williamsia herbipolensis]